MGDTLLPTVKTLVTLDAYVGALLRGWKVMAGLWPSRESVGVLWAQYALETGGGAHCYNNNLGNVKHVAGDGFDYCQLHGVWEGMLAETYVALQGPPLGHLIHLDQSPDHQKAVGPGKLAVAFDPPHPATWFRSYPSLASAMSEHLRFLRDRRYAAAWPAVEQGNVALFAAKLHAAGYYTASVNSYAAGMQRWFDAYGKSDAYEHAFAEISSDAEVNTSPALPEGTPILHPIAAFPSYGDEEPPSDNIMVTEMLAGQAGGVAGPKEGA